MLANLLASLLGQGANADMRLVARVTAPAGRGPAAGGRAAIEKISVEAGPLRVAGHAAWESGAADSWFGGPLDVDILTSLDSQNADVPDASPARTNAGGGLLPAKARLQLALGGPLDAPDVRAALDCPA